MKRIAIDARELRTSTGRYIERLLHYLQLIDSDHEYVVLLKPNDFDSWTPTNKKFSKVACPYKEFTFAEQLGMHSQIRSLKVDLVHFPIVQQPILYRGDVVTSMLDLTTVRFRNPAKNVAIFWIKQQVYKVVNKVVARKSKHIITISDFVKNDIAQYAHIPTDKITTTYLAADKITDESETVADMKGKQFIMYVGRPQPHKNLERLVQAFKKLNETHPELHLVLAGKKDVLFEMLEQYVKDNGVKNVYFTGFVSEGQLRWLYENGQAYVFPSLSEGFGLPGLEAMQYNLPVVSSNATCLPEVYKDAALYFNPVSIDDMAIKIKQVLSDKKLANDLAKKGSELVKTYSWERMAQQTLDVYRSVID